MEYARSSLRLYITDSVSRFFCRSESQIVRIRPAPRAGAMVCGDHRQQRRPWIVCSPSNSREAGRRVGSRGDLESLVSTSACQACGSTSFIFQVYADCRTMPNELAFPEIHREWRVIGSAWFVLCLRSNCGGQDMIAAEYLGASRLFQSLRSGPHGQHVELYAARLVKDELAGHGTWRCLSLVGGLLSWTKRWGLNLTDLDEDAPQCSPSSAAERRRSEAMSNSATAVANDGSIAAAAVRAVASSASRSPEQNGSRLGGRSFSIRSISMSSSPFPTRSPWLPSRSGGALLEATDHLR